MGSMMSEGSDRRDIEHPRSDPAKSAMADRPPACSAPQVSPWRVVATQAGVGVAVALLAALLTGRGEVLWSALYGAAVVVVPAALMARGMTSRLTSASPGVSAVGFLGWEFVKIAVSVAMLALASRIVVPLSWPALLLGLVVCIKVYWVALLWRGRSSTKQNEANGS